MLYQGIFCEDLTRREETGGCSVHKVLSIETAVGTKSTLIPKYRGNVWIIGTDITQRITQVTIRLCPRNTADISLNMIYAVNDQMIWHQQLNTSMNMDIMFLYNMVGYLFRGFNCCKVYATDFGYMLAHMMERESNVPKKLKWTFNKFLVPSNLIAD